MGGAPGRGTVPHAPERSRRVCSIMIWTMSAILLLAVPSQLAAKKVLPYRIRTQNSDISFVFIVNVVGFFLDHDLNE